MYPRIYKRNETDFSHNGYGVLKDLIKCEVIEEDNGMFELEGECTISSFLFEYIQEENIIKAWASEELGEQLFRIYRVQKNLDGYITFNAQHISYDLLDNFIESIELVDVTCENAINEIFNHCAYETSFRGHSDISHKGNIILQRVNPMEAIRGTRGSICDTFGNGAKVIKDNFNIRVNANRGANNNVLIAYKKNLIGFESEIDTSDLVTVIFPYATIQSGDEEDTSDEVIQLQEKYIYSDNHKNYNNLKIMPVDFSGDDVGSVESLRTKASKYFKNSKCDIPKVNYKVEFIALSKTVNYADYKVLESVSMCDKVIVRDYRFNLDVEAQVIKTTHCSLTKKLLSCELGNFKNSLSDIVGDINKEQAEINYKLDKVKISIDNEIGEVKVTVKDEVEKLESSMTLTAQNLKTEFKDIEQGLSSQIKQNAQQITQKVSSGEFESYKTQTAELISSKVGSDNLSSILEQNPTSIQIGFNKINDNVVIDSNSMKFKDSAGNQSLSFMRGSLYAYEPNSSVFMGAGLIPRWNSGSYNAGFGVLAGSNSYYYSIARASNWGADTSSNPGSIEEYFIINYRDRGSALSQRQGCHTYYKLYTSGGINGMGYDIENVSTTKTLDLNVGTIRDTNGSQALVLGSSSITNGMNWNFNYFTLSNVAINTSSSCTLGSTSASSIQTGTYKGSAGTTLFTAYSTVNNSVGWAWNKNNLLDPYIIGGVYGYSIEEGNSNTRNINNADLDNILDSIDIYVSEANAKNKDSKSLEIDVSNLRNNENSNLFIKEREVTDFETGEAKIVENIDMKSMLHLALLEIKNLKEEVRSLKNKNL